MDYWTLLAIFGGFVLDLLLGDPHWLYHPVRLIGKLIFVLERPLRRIFPKTAAGEHAAGCVLAFFVCLSTVLVPKAAIHISEKYSVFLRFAVETVLVYWLFAVRSLRDESMKVYRALKRKDLAGARRAVSMIVGRDTKRLTEDGVTKAAVETVAENASDGVVAPMLFLVIGGPVLGWFYKAVNTMDSMVGYRNERYLYFGRFAAKLDDAVNFIPSRLCALLMIASCPLTGLDARGALKIFRRDRLLHASPNSGQTESVMAGALGVQLAGDAWYFGRKVAKPVIGDALRPIEAEDIRRANRLMIVSSMLGLILLLLLRLLVVITFKI